MQVSFLWPNPGLTDEQWDETLVVVLKGIWITCKVAIPHRLPRRRSKIICIGSTGSFKGLAGLGHYAAAKHGVIGPVKTRAIELAPYSINVNAICPTTVDTDTVNIPALFEYFVGGSGPQATRECTIQRMNEMNRFFRQGTACSRKYQCCCVLVGTGRGSTYYELTLSMGSELAQLATLNLLM